MTAPFGLNVLSQFVHDRAALLNWLRAAKPAAVVAMDDSALTQQIRAVLPNSIVIHRAYSPNDGAWHRTVSPQEWLNAHVPFSAQGVRLYCFNEPNGYDNVAPLIDWCVAVLKLAHQQGVSLVIGNFGVGHPNENLISNGTFDPLIKALVNSPSYLGLHEYWSTDETQEQPYHIGRSKYWYDRCHVLNIAPIKVVFTEFGRDAGAR